jgi:AraC family ethanolamine operon transcriptional activator
VPPPANPTITDRPPSVTVTEITDPTAVSEGIDVIEQEAVQLGATQLRARRIIVRLGQGALVYHSTNLSIRTRSAVQPGLVAFVTFGPRAAGTVNGLPIRPNCILASTPGTTVQFVVAGGYESVSLLLCPDDIRTHLRDRHRENEFRVQSGAEWLQTTGASATALFDWGRRLAEVAGRSPALFQSPQVNRAAQVELIETLLGTLGSAVDAELTSKDLTMQAHSRVVQIAEEYTLTHPAEYFYVTDLCRAADVSERTLQGAFRDVMGMTPVAYLARLRLHRVRQALRVARPRSTTVTAEALKWGFWHFGDFSRAYRNCFGEVPSDTLRRKRSARSLGSE